MQMFSSIATPAVSSLLSSSQVQSALAKSSPQDIVQLSDQAMQLQMADGLFAGASTSSQATPGGLTMADLFAPVLSPSSSSADALSQMESSNLAQQSVLAAVYTNSSNASGSFINLLA